MAPDMANAVRNEYSGPSCTSDVAPVTIFMFDAGMNSFPAFSEYSVSPRSGSTIKTPKCEFRNSACVTIESIACRSIARETGALGAGAAAVGGAVTVGVGGIVDGAVFAAGVAVAVVPPVFAPLVAHANAIIPTTTTRVIFIPASPFPRRCPPMS